MSKFFIENYIGPSLSIIFIGADPHD